jgi:hypothetical protein
MKIVLLILSGAFICNLSFAQIAIKKTDTTASVYKGLDTKKFYRIGFSSTVVNGVTTYEINDKVVSKTIYDRYHDTWENMATCKPCILLTYDINEKLLYKGIQYTDCRVGYFIEYFSNGKVKLIGHYKENESGNWENSTCNNKDGAFTYFNEEGEELYTEIWKDSKFFKRIPK